MPPEEQNGSMNLSKAATFFSPGGILSCRRSGELQARPFGEQGPPSKQVQADKGPNRS